MKIATLGLNILVLFLMLKVERPVKKELFQRSTFLGGKCDELYYI